MSLLFLSLWSLLMAMNDVSPKCVAELEDANIQLFSEEHGEWLRNFSLKVGSRTYFFPEWENMNGDKRTWPQLHSADVTGDGREEILVFLVKARGNGLYKNEVHILEHKSDAIEEVVIEDPRAVVLKNIKMKQTEQGVELVVDHVHALIPNDETKASNQNVQLSIDHFVKYTIEKNHLKAILLLERKSGEYLGSLIVTYRYKNGVLQGEDIEFIRH
ncbi:hypothetical protein EDD69_1044 [Thermolongibacillus altinsuensis]|uniref:Uncharacterized protein n=1 Tax=Thermolongibacillus altinsuensis TaxID=575256 RepID=A0A4R1QHI7_9BACL|nr:hypothetical protein [Thermolongibacillus altinsuensis]TCL50956.1 hypothetical protein EDD69_1044 [Thermolongibacillus altinsuensis]GMB08975.1 hypothetical protein B1no1_16850 [Thermolongibacillus altinsuensis]